MTDVTPQPVRGLDRRTLLRSGLLIGGATMAAIASSAFPVAAQAGQAPASGPATLASVLPISPNVTYSTQLSWNWCNKCKGLFFGPQQSASFCPAGGQHNGSGSFDYSMFYNVSPPQTDPQPGWNWCNKCKGQFYGPNQGSSWCPAGGRHNGSGSFAYSMPYNGTGGQADWAWCHLCQGLFYGPQASSSWCPSNADTRHDGTGSFNYHLVYTTT